MSAGRPRLWCALGRLARLVDARPALRGRRLSLRGPASRVSGRVNSYRRPVERQLALEIERSGRLAEDDYEVPITGGSASQSSARYDGRLQRAHEGADAQPTRLDFACEEGGLAFRDSRPDPQRLERIASATGGKSVLATQLRDLPLPAATEVTLERRSSPLLPAWLWSLGAALGLGVHWLLRRQRGLA